ncbi:WD40 repeat-like protein, partial [Nadsonia fulvescens var. elongata DSM 6958]
PTFSQADLNRIVLEYLNKKGYTKTEAMLRMESTRPPGTVSTNTTNPSTGTAGGATSPSVGNNAATGYTQNNERVGFSRSGTPGATGSSSTSQAGSTVTSGMINGVKLSSTANDDPAVYDKAYILLRDWTESSLDLYKPELRRLLYPIFIHSFLDLISKEKSSQAREFFDKYSTDHMILHSDDIKKLSGISLPDHLKENELAKAFRKSKYRLGLSRTTFDLLLYFLHEHETAGGAVIIRLINQYIDTKVIAARPNRSDSENILKPDEGIPDSTIHGQIDKFNSQAIRLGKLPFDPEFEKEVESVLRGRDEVEKLESQQGEIGSTGANTLIEEFEKIKQEINNDSPAREILPLPPYKGADVLALAEKVGDSRAKMILDCSSSEKGFRLPSVCMYTFHNTHDSLNCLEFSDDSTLVAGGFSDSFIKIWSLNGKKLNSVLRNDQPTSSRKLVGHSGPVYGLSFSPDSKYLVSSSEDKTVRLWSLDTYTSLVSYKGHNHPVWDVAFSPFGHYFATASHDQTARLWSLDHIYPLRIFVGHMSDVECVAFHPNGAYVITGSRDKTCRMWDINRGSSVRVMLGHTGPVNCVSVSPDGKWLASAGDDSVVNIWDLSSGKRLKTMTGHGRAPIYSVTWSREGNILVSAGADNSVRVWNVKQSIDDNGTTDMRNVYSDMSGFENFSTADRSDSIVDDIKRKKEIVATSDHMGVYHTKKTPVYKVHFTRRNLCLAGGAFM